MRLVDADAAIDAAVKESQADGAYGYMDTKEIVDMLKGLPTAQPKKGKWILLETAYEDTEAKCSICGFYTLVNEPGNGLHMVDDLNYCPHCGARMVNEDG